MQVIAESILLPPIVISATIEEAMDSSQQLYIAIILKTEPNRVIGFILELLAIGKNFIYTRLSL